MPVGTTGESPTLSHAEHERVVELCVEVAAGRVPVIAGTGSNSTEEAISLTRHAKQAGADAALVVTPYYNKPTQAGSVRALPGDPRRGRPADHHLQHPWPLGGRHDARDDGPPGQAAATSSGVKDASADIVRPLLTHAACGAEFCQLSGEDAQHRGVPGAWRPWLHLGDRQRGAAPVRASCIAAWRAGRPDEALAVAPPADAAASGAVLRDQPGTGQVRAEPDGPLLGRACACRWSSAPSEVEAEVDAALAAVGLIG